MTRSVHRPRLAATAVAAGLVAVLIGAVTSPVPSDAQGRGDRPRNRNMKLLAHDDLQARSAYQPVIHEHPGTNRWIAYVGHHAGTALNPLTGEEENNGTSIIDVTNPRRPRYLHHIPGAPGEDGGAQMVRVCNGSDLPAGDPTKVYLLRTFGNESHQIWDVSDPAAPTLLTTVVDGLNGTHKSWWECDTGIAYLVSGVPGWRTERMTQVFDLGDPTDPVHIRDFGLVGQEPGSTGPVPTELHGPISLGNRVYFGYGTEADGIIQIVDRDKLLNGDPEPTPENLLFPQIARLDLSSLGGAHTVFPVLGVPVRDHQDFAIASTRDILVTVNESGFNECAESPQLVYMTDITDETTPQVISNYQVRESEGQYCQVGGRFGAHSSNENMTPRYYRKLVFVSYFNAGVRAVDIRDPFNPSEVGRFIPRVTANTDERCVVVDGVERCKTAIQTNNVEVDDRGFVYIVDRANTGMHILQPTGKAARIANR